MIQFFRRAKALDDFIDAIRPELIAIQTPAPTSELKARISSSRAAGVRNILPVQEERRVPARFGVAVAVAAVLTLLLIPIQLRRSANTRDDLVSSGVFGNAAFAQPPRRGDRPALAPVRVTDATKLRPLFLQFERRIVDNGGKARVTGQQSLQLSNASLGGSATWQLVAIRRESAPTLHTEYESVYVAKSDLHLLRRTIHVSPYSRFQRINVWQQFSGDSVAGRMTTEGPSIGVGRAFARELAGAFSPITTEAVAPIFFMAVPLRAQWSGSVSLLGWAVRDNDVMYPIEMRVDSSETITTPAGKFDCWRLSLRFSGKQIDYWVRKSDGLGVRVVNKTTPNGTREILLTRIQ